MWCNTLKAIILSNVLQQTPQRAMCVIHPHPKSPLNTGQVFLQELLSLVASQSPYLTFVCRPSPFNMLCVPSMIWVHKEPAVIHREVWEAQPCQSPVGSPIITYNFGSWANISSDDGNEMMSFSFSMFHLLFHEHTISTKKHVNNCFS